METACLRHTDIPHTSQLFSDFQYHFDRVSRFYDHYSGDAGAYAKAAKELAYPEERRASLVAALRARNGDGASLELLAQAGTVAVVTGQQVGLFSGPAYSIYKALTAARLAEELRAQGIPAVPIFWLATEDHDFAEVNHSFVFDAEHRPVSLSVNGSIGTERPVGTIPIEAPPADRLRAAFAGFPYGAEVADMVAQSYRPGVTFGAAFQALLERLLAKCGLLFIDPLDDAVRRLAAPLLREALRDGKNLHAKLQERNRELEAAGYHAQVHLEAKTSLVFLLEGGRRITLRKQNGEFVSKDRRYSVAELSDLAEHLSPNALLRPVVQDYLLPTVAYVGGPAELAYMAQSQVIYDDLLHRMPVMVARNGFTLLDARTAKLMDKYGLALTGFFHGEDAVREAIARKLVPEALAREFEQVQGGAARSLDELRAVLQSFDATLAEATDKGRAKIMYQLSKIERKTAREMLRRNERAAEDARYMSDLIFPEKHLQERFYSILPFVARHGLGLMAVLLACAGPAGGAFTTNAVVDVEAPLASSAHVTLSPTAISFPDSDPNAVPSIAATQNPVTVTASATTGAGNTVTLTVLANGDLVSGSNTIAISNVTWTASGTGFVAGTLNKSTAQPVGHWTGSGTRTGSLSFFLKNSWSYATGSYSQTATFTLTAP
jgi:bacillithiol biosynthesis cysteine-adding enzyme BshC